MAYARYTEFEPTDDRSTEVYDAIADVWNDPPAGLILHCAGYSDDGVWRGVDVWETREDAERFFSDRMLPAILEATDGSPQPPPIQEIFELHNLVEPTGRG